MNCQKLLGGFIFLILLARCERLDFRRFNELRDDRVGRFVDFIDLSAVAHARHGRQKRSTRSHHLREFAPRHLNDNPAPPT